MSHDDDNEFQEEYRAIRKDLKAVLVTNGVLLALLIALYFVNQSTGFLD